MTETPDIAYNIFVITLILALVFVFAVAITKKIYEWGKRDGIDLGIAIGERNELRRRDDMNLRARVIAELQMQKDAEEERNQWEIDA